MLRTASSDQQPYWDISTWGTSDWSLGLKTGFQTHISAQYSLALQRTKADYPTAIVTITKINHLQEKLPGTTCKICLPLLPMHMRLCCVHVEQILSPHTHTIKTSFHLCAVSNDEASPSICWQQTRAAVSGLLLTHPLKHYSPKGEGPAG